MSIAHLLEDFGTANTGKQTLKSMNETDLQDLRLESFEQGHTAGWKDATAAREKDHRKLSITLANNLEDLSFTYHEAYSQLLNSVRPVFQIMVDTVIPNALATSYGPKLLDEVMTMTQEILSEPARILVPPGAGPAVKGLVQANGALPVEITEDDSLVAGQALLRVGTQEGQLDTRQLTASFSDAVNTYFHHVSEEVENG